jgi:hypothetical protein
MPDSVSERHCSYKLRNSFKLKLEVKPANVRVILMSGSPEDQ